MARGTEREHVPSRRSLNQFVEVKGQELANYLAKISAEPLFADDTLVLDANVMGLCSNKDVLYASVVNKKNEIVTSRFSSFNKDAPQVAAAKKRLGAEFGNQDLINALKNTYTLSELAAPVIMDEETIGKVVVGMSKDKVRHEVRAMVLSVIVVFALLCLAACSVLMIISRRIVLRPLETIARVSSLVAQGDFTQRVHVVSSDEIGALGGTFNTLVENLNLTVERINGSFANLDEVAAKVGDLAERIARESDDQMTAVHSAYADVGVHQSGGQELG